MSAYPKLPNDGWRDGRFLTFNELHPTQRSDLYVLSTKRGEAIPLVVTDAEVYVRDFAPDRRPAVGSVKLRVSTEGGDKPRWRRDGTELYYVAPDGRLMAVPVRHAPAFAIGTPVRLFDVDVPRSSFFPYDVAADGRFLVNAFDAPDTERPDRLTVVLNWMSGQ